MIKKILVSLSLVFAGAVMAQQGTASPYSFYGLGNVNYNGTNEYKAMGGTDVYADSIHINLNNPASLAKLKYTTFTLGATAKFFNFKADQNSESVNRQTLDYMALAFPIGKKVGVSFGLLPFSTVGYKIQNSVLEDGKTVSRTFTGDGGVSDVFIAAGYQILDNLAIGAEFNYNFGDTDNYTYTWISDRGDGIPLATQTVDSRKIEYKGLSYKIAAQYEKTIGVHQIQANLSYAPETKWDADRLRKLATYNMNNVYYPIEEITLHEGKDKVINPTSISFGAGYGREFKWFVGAQYTFTENSKLSDSWNTTVNSSFENSQRVSVGGFYIPKYNSFTNYFDRVVYRAGLRWENTGLVMNNKSINDYAVSAGVGLPVRGFTNINIGFEYGQTGTSSNGLIKQNYFSMSIGLSLSDSWFNRRKFE